MNPVKRLRSSRRGFYRISWAMLTLCSAANSAFARIANIFVTGSHRRHLRFVIR